MTWIKWKQKTSCFENRRTLEDYLKTYVVLVVVVCAEKKTQCTSMSEREIFCLNQKTTLETRKKQFLCLNFFKIMPKKKQKRIKNRNKI